MHAVRTVTRQPPNFLVGNQQFMQLVNDKCRPELVSQLSVSKKELDELLELEKNCEKELVDMVKAEIDEAVAKLHNIEQLLLSELVEDDSYVTALILEAKCGVGGQEAMLFASELLDVYRRYCSYRGWSVTELSRQDSDIGGIISASVKVEGKRCYQYFRHEAGVHRVQRTPKTEKAGRIHTSTATVNVLPVRGNELDIRIDPSELKIDAKRSSGPGGQHVNKTESCAVVKHVPTGITIECQESRSFNANRETAISKLRDLLLAQKQQQLFAEQSSQRKHQVASADRSEKVRTYNFAQDRITDHRINVTLHGIRDFMEGDAEKLDSLIAKLEDQYVADEKAKLINSLKSS